MSQPLNQDQHSAILIAYLSRIRVNELKQIVRAAEICQAASLNLGMNAQISAGNALDARIKEAVSHLIEHDQVLISNVIHKQISNA